MAEQINSEGFWPTGYRAPGDRRPGSAILQERDGRWEPVTPSGNMVWDEETKLWLPVSEDHPLPVKPTLSGSLGNHYRIDFVNTNIANSDGQVTVIEVEGPCILEYLEWSCNDTSLEVRLTGDRDWQQAVFSGTSTPGRTPNFSVNRIVNYGSTLWRVLLYDSSISRYKVDLRRRLFAPNGLHISVRNPDAQENHGLAMVGSIREVT